MTGKTEKFKSKKGVKNRQDYDINNKLRPLTFEEKQALGQKIRNLSSTYFEGILDIVKNQTSNQNQDNIEFDINKLPAKVARELEKYVNDKLSKQNKKESQNLQGTKQQPAKAPKAKLPKQWNQYQKMPSPMDPLIPQQAMQYQSEEQQKKLLEQRLEVHQQMMKLKQQQEISLKQGDKNIIGQLPQMQQYMGPQMQQFSAQQQVLNQNNLMEQNQMQNIQLTGGQVQMPSQEQEDEEKKSLSSFLTDSEDDSI